MERRKPLIAGSAIRADASAARSLPRLKEQVFGLM